MYKRVLCLGMIAVSLFWGATAAQQSELSGLYIREQNRWQADLISLLGEDWYLRLTVGALANIQPGPFQASGFASLRLGLMWNPNWFLSPRLHLTRATHELSIGLEGLGTEPYWALEITPFILEFNINPRQAPARSTATPLVEQPAMRSDQQASIDLKALVLKHLDDLLKASDQVSKDNPTLDPATLRDPLNEFKKAFEAGKMSDAGMQVDIFSVTLRLMQKNEFLKGLQETYLRAGLYRLVVAFALWREQVQRQTVKVCTGLYVSEDQKTEEVLSPLMTDVIKKLTFTNKQTGVKETFTLKESKCF